MGPDTTRRRGWLYRLLALALIALIAAILLAMGRTPICKCGTVEWWHGTVNDSGNSQHLTDWYTFSHIIHGFLFYMGTWLLGRVRGKALPVGLAFLHRSCARGSLGNRREHQSRSSNAIARPISRSIITATASSTRCPTSWPWSLGFWLARLWPVWLTVLAALVMELFVGYMIRDNLALNIIMLIHPIEAINQWQSGA